ncbi:MAG: ABC transporter ATP-binding protein [Rhodothermaceae bacterium]
MEKVVDVQNLTHYYGSKLVYEDFNFHINKGSIFGLLGKNGTGKTTTINILNGFLKPRSGNCFIFGEESHKLSPQTKAQIGFLIEGHIQFDFMNIKQIEKFYSGFYPDWKKENYYELMAKLKVTETQKISKMSCGQRSQVALGLILAQNPELLILDDYSMGLDTGYRKLFVEYLREYAVAEGKTVFITSHILQDLENFLDDCVIMDYNNVLLQSSVTEFMDSFKKYTFKYSGKELGLEKNDLISNYEIIKDKYEIYSFSEENKIRDYLKKFDVNYTDFAKEEMNLEDAFLGLTGKY